VYRNRDMGINCIRARKDHRCYGMGLGIVILDDVYPGFPGDVRNASAYPFPIQYEVAEGAAGRSPPNVATLPIFSERSPAARLIPAIRRSARECGPVLRLDNRAAGHN